MVCRENGNGSLEVLEQVNLDFWTEVHRLVCAKELLLCYGSELALILFDHISVSSIFTVFDFYF